MSDVRGFTAAEALAVVEAVDVGWTGSMGDEQSIFWTRQLAAWSANRIGGDVRGVDGIAAAHRLFVTERFRPSYADLIEQIDALATERCEWERQVERGEREPVDGGFYARFPELFPVECHEATPCR